MAGDEKTAGPKRITPRAGQQIKKRQRQEALLESVTRRMHRRLTPSQQEFLDAMNRLPERQFQLLVSTATPGSRLYSLMEKWARFGREEFGQELQREDLRVADRRFLERQVQSLPRLGIRLVLAKTENTS